MIVTTPSRTTQRLDKKAQRMASELNIPFYPRDDQSIAVMQTIYHQDVLVVGEAKMMIYRFGSDEPIFFHPNSAMFRVRRFVRGETDPLLLTSQLKEGMSFLDCTLGLGADAILASVAVGPRGRVVGIEANSYVGFLVSEGLKRWESGQKEMDKAMKAIEIVQDDHRHYLHTLPDDSFDIVYFDPMFEETVDVSNGIKPLKVFASYSPLTDNVIAEATRVARHRIVLKDHWKSKRFEELGFTVIKRPSATFHYGFIDIEKKGEKHERKVSRDRWADSGRQNEN
ncbi:class I SAM-dependent methyltransferase [Desertibacillus haloalkaliphilus]|uniref:class I SAM-dependent methyltransferase n=1 Tax=Desertibacillus haloalkaliphilus TaxID=1328930 RepID=UPI001C26451A|nr:class I SAM-dependent methyltransferase [Desertibacillus haloalkaliphilus]